MPPAPTALRWTTIVPFVGAVGALLGLAFTIPGWLHALLVPLLVVTVLSSVEHAEAIGHRTGEPYGSLVLALSVTAIEVGLIVALMSGGGEATATLARDTLFAAVMICCNLMVGASLVAGAPRRGVARFSAAGCRAGLGTIATITTLTLVLPSFTTSASGAHFTPFQLGFAAISALLLWTLFVLEQTVNHRDLFIQRDADDDGVDDALQDEDEHDGQRRPLWRSIALLLVALFGVIGLAKELSGPIEDLVLELGIEQAVVGVLVALVVLMPETLTAVRAARRGAHQTAFNLSYGSAVASIGLTIPVLAFLSPLLPTKLQLGLEPVHVVLLTVTMIVSVLTIVPGRATRLQGAVHLVILAAFIALAFNP